MKRKPIFRKILFPLLLLVLAEIIILICGISGTKLIQKLEQNEIDLVNEKVNSRNEYVENLMLNEWADLDYAVSTINSTTDQLLKNGSISLDTLDASSMSAEPLLNEVADDLVDVMRSNSVTGVFLVLNTEDLEPSMASGDYVDKPGIYLRDTDPTSTFSSANTDITIERAPVSVVKKLGIATGNSWKMNFSFEESNQAYYDFLYYPFQAAYENTNYYSWKEMGYWSSPYQLNNESRYVFSYSVPLVLDDGTVYGVLGIDISLVYLRSLLPYLELDSDGSGAYFLSRYSEETGKFTHAFGNTNNTLFSNGEEESLIVDDNQYYVYTKDLDLYNKGTPFYEQNWVFAGIVPYSCLQKFVKTVIRNLALCVLLTYCIAVAGSLIVSLRIHRPIAKLSSEIMSKDPDRFIHLHPTGITEIDQLSDALENFSHNLIESNRKFSAILEKASVKLAVFEINQKDKSLFCTDHFFALFGMPGLDKPDMTVLEFKRALSSLRTFCIEQDTEKNQYLYRISDDEDVRYISLNILADSELQYGLAEDVTRALREKELITHERDHDSLTNLYNRRAFRSHMDELFYHHADQIGIGAYVMMDLDNLKYVNDTFGHDYGDQYILQAAAALSSSVDGAALYARISGDEFNIFLYGCKTTEEAIRRIERIKADVDSRFIVLPDGMHRPLKASMGVAWYPSDSRLMDELSKYADYAMYVVKKGKKGGIHYFEKSAFDSDTAITEHTAALTQLIDNQSIYYMFQPIVDAHTGKIFAYEALMRSDSDTFESVQELMDAAKQENRLTQIECLTWTVAMRVFVQHLESGQIAPDTYLFINSIPNQRMTPEVEAQYIEDYKDYHKQVVLELTEDEQISGPTWNEKQALHRKLGGKIALDDFGSGYNNEKMLLNVSSDFIKLDRNLITDIYKNTDKRSLVEYFVTYAHERGKLIVAEGVESKKEARALIKLGVDYLQGFYLGSPNVEPSDVSKEALETIQEMQGE